MPTSEEIELAMRLLAGEAAALGSAVGPADSVGAADHLLGQLHGHLADWIGGDGSYAVFARALDRARVGHPVLRSVRLASPARVTVPAPHRPSPFPRI